MEAAHFFEGTEKLLEVWFSRQQPDANQGSGDLRTIPMITPSWLSGPLRCFLYSSSVYSCHLFLISSASVRSIPFLFFIVPIFS
ncbi:hypothetical protein FD754_003205 [Muntiacus muntjak]|uniref:Uncharacterized protein n=1 Tax=Muntiacus muntjak TaxID=9888 RepID=A0A5N3WBG2_MUNMU|nr:hypothetical protein FD754_003205 [Muntiacus muntjak]